ncbi:MAG TPA: GtrA family protein [Egibacteraceae bacterium]|nr:GtrA family protein [Egibacteraceae bacterium]
MHDAVPRGPAVVAKELVWYLAVGTASTVLFLALYNILRPELEPFAANGLAISLAVLMSFLLNRRFTFRRRGRLRWARQLLEFSLVFAVTLGGSSIGLAMLIAAVPGASRMAENFTLLVSGAVTFAVRFMLLRGWVFRHGR